MRIDFTFYYASICIDKNLISGHETKTYIAWIARLKFFCFWMTYNTDRWPTDLVSQWASGSHLANLCGVNLLINEQKKEDLPILTKKNI